VWSLSMVSLVIININQLLHRITSKQSPLIFNKTLEFVLKPKLIFLIAKASFKESKIFYSLISFVIVSSIRK